MTLVANQLERQCRLVLACEVLADAARNLDDFADSAEALDLWRLPIVTETAIDVARAQADALGGWASQAAPHDAVLARELRRVAEAFAAVADGAARASELARAFADSESFDDAVAEQLA